MDNVEWFLPVLLKALIVFAATNTDDFILLIMLLQQNNTQKLRIILGQYVGFIVIVTISLLGSFCKLIIPLEWISFLNLIPFVLGVKKLMQTQKFSDSGKSGVSILTVSILTISDGTDNISTYIPLFAKYPTLYIYIFAISFLVFLAIWYVIACLLIQFGFIGCITNCLDRLFSRPFVALTNSSKRQTGVVLVLFSLWAFITSR